MTLEYILQPRVLVVLKELNWGDRFESDLQQKISEISGGPESLADIRNELLKNGLILQLKGGQGSPYLSLTYKGQLIVDRLLETEEMLASEDVDQSGALPQE
ncbi:MAG: hypothetical protein EAX81_06185 [Candidatus Thorarchaeota archaeon]|nr:hypothetical protein [Candidatus Thorarchaeota archaeon]